MVDDKGMTVTYSGVQYAIAHSDGHLQEMSVGMGETKEEYRERIAKGAVALGLPLFSRSVTTVVSVSEWTPVTTFGGV